jgi:alanine dehydrogenase
MKIGVPKEIKDHEFRVGMTPGSVRELISRGHQVVVQSNAGKEAGFLDEMYRQSGATLVATADEVYATAEMIVKVKELQLEEYTKMHKDQLLFTYLHLAIDLKQLELLQNSGCIECSSSLYQDNASQDCT